MVVTEGSVTEPEYLAGFVAEHRQSLVDVEVDKGRGVPYSIVEWARTKKVDAERDAKRSKDPLLKYDEVWCAFDVDSHPRIPDAKVLAAQYDIQLAISNPCIELWLILHFRESPGPQHRHHMQQQLTEFMPTGKHVDYELLAPGYLNARDRAERLDKHASEDDEDGRNPTTGFWRLTERIAASAAS